MAKKVRSRAVLTQEKKVRYLHCGIRPTNRSTLPMLSCIAVALAILLISTFVFARARRVGHLAPTTERTVPLYAKQEALLRNLVIIQHKADEKDRASFGSGASLRGAVCSAHSPRVSGLYATLCRCHRPLYTTRRIG